MLKANFKNTISIFPCQYGLLIPSVADNPPAEVSTYSGHANINGTHFLHQMRTWLQ